MYSIPENYWHCREGLAITLMGLVTVGTQLVASLQDLVEMVDVQHFL